MSDPLSDVFAALADPTRRSLVARLAVSDANVGQLAEPFDISIQGISKHLKVLESAGLVTKTRDAQRTTVHLEAQVFDLMTKWVERYRHEAERRYQRLDSVLADMDGSAARSGSAASSGSAARSGSVARSGSASRDLPPEPQARTTKRKP